MASSVSVSIWASSSSRAPVSTSTCWMAATSSSLRSARRRSAAPRPGRRRRARWRWRARRGLALAEVVADRLAGERGVAEHAEHVVAELERVAERQAVGRERGQQLGRAGAASAAPRCSGARRCTCRTCSGRCARPSPGRARRGPCRGCRGTGRCSARCAARSRRARPASGAPRSSVVGVDEGEVADQDGDAFAEAAGLPAPVADVVAVGEHEVGGAARPGGWPSRP